MDSSRMLKSLEDISATKKRLRIEIPSEAIEDRIGESLAELRKRTKLPGYRQGKAPVSLIEKRFGKEVEGDVVRNIVPEHYMEAVREAGLKPVADPVIEDAADFKRLSPLSLTFTVEVFPRLENVDYKNLTVTDIPVEIEESEIESTLKRIQEDKASYEPTGGPLREGDLSIIDFEIKESGSKQTEQVFKLGSDFLPKEFTDALIGKKKGDELDLSVKYPEDFRLKAVAGKELNYHVAVKDAKRPELPAVDDELAKDVGFDSLDALKEHIRAELMKSKENTVRNIQKAEALKKVIEAHKVDVPETLLERELNSLVAEALQKGEIVEKDIEKTKPELRDKAERNIQASILIDIIGEEEKVSVTEEEIKEKIVELSGRLSLTPENVMKYYMARDGSLEGLKHGIFEDKVLGLILEGAERVKEKK